MPKAKLALDKLGEGAIVKRKNDKYKKKGRKFVRLGWFGRETGDIHDLDDVLVDWLIYDIISDGVLDGDMIPEVVEPVNVLDTPAEAAIVEEAVGSFESVSVDPEPYRAPDPTPSFDSSPSYDSGSSYDSGGDSGGGGWD